jgi:Cell wall-active antibiotics response 4TMS YvqF
MDDKRPSRRSGAIWAGLFLLLVGGVLLLDQLGFPLPDWLFNWHTLLIAIGLFIGFRTNFHGGAWIILIIVGGAYTLQDYYPTVKLERFILPGILIMIGLAIISGRGGHRPHRWHREWQDDWENKWGRKRWKYDTEAKMNAGSSPTGDPSSAGGPSWTGAGYTSEDFIDSTSIFSGIHKKVVSKTFKGGDVVTMMGGAEIDLSQADFSGTVRLDVTQIMGGTKIIVPPHWEVRTEVTAIFAGFEDKRQQPAVLNPEKVLIIDGTSIFGGIELKSF